MDLTSALLIGLALVLPVTAACTPASNLKAD